MKTASTTKKILFALLILLSVVPVSARRVLSGLDFSQGEWKMVGVSLHNYHLMPIQEKLGTFVLKDAQILQKIQMEWDFEEKFDDYCDYHYALKFYKDGNLVRTLRANLLCNYISWGGLSFEFTQEDLLEYRRYFRPIQWSRIRFRDPELLKIAIHELEVLDDVYWYGDMKQYDFNGFFLTGVDSLPWNANRDSVADTITSQLAIDMGRDDFYLTVSHWYMTDDLNYMHLRFRIYSSEDFALAYPRKDVLVRWRTQYSQQAFIQIMVIGLNKKQYYQAMKQHLN